MSCKGLDHAQNDIRDESKIFDERLNNKYVLGYVHTRKDPNKVRFISILQPFRDAIKLFGFYLF